MLQETREVPADYHSLIQRVKVFQFADLKRATRNFSPDLRLGEGSFGEVFLGWVDPNTFTFSKHGDGVAVAVKRLNPNSLQGHAEWQASITICKSNYIFN